MIKLQFLNTAHNLLTKFHMEKVGPFLLFNFLTWYKVITYILNVSWTMKFIGDAFTLIMWLYLKMVFGPYIAYYTRH